MSDLGKAEGRFALLKRGQSFLVTGTPLAVLHYAQVQRVVRVGRLLFLLCPVGSLDAPRPASLGQEFGQHLRVGDTDLALLHFAVGVFPGVAGQGVFLGFQDLAHFLVTLFFLLDVVQVVSLVDLHRGDGNDGQDETLVLTLMGSEVSAS